MDINKLSKTRRRVLGIPVTIAIPVLLIVIVGGFAMASILFQAKIATSGNVSAVPSIAWSNPNAGYGLDPSFPMTDGSGINCTPSVDEDGLLSIAVVDAYPESECRIRADFTVPSGAVRITGLSLGTPALTAIFESPSWATSAALLNLIIDATAVPQTVTAYIKITVSPSAPVGPIAGTGGVTFASVANP